MIRKTLFLLLTGVFLLTALPACSRKDSNKEVKQIKIMTGADQAALPGETFQQPLRVEVLGSAGKDSYPDMIRSKILHKTLNSTTQLVLTT